MLLTLALKRSQFHATGGRRGMTNGNLRVSESRSKVHLDYAEREQVQDDGVGLNRKT